MTVPLEFIFLLDVVLVSRLVFAFQNKPINIFRVLFLSFIQILGLAFFCINRDWFGTILLFSLIILFQYLLENNGIPIHKVRSFSIVIYIIMIIFISSQRSNLTFNPSILSISKNYSTYIIHSYKINTEFFNKIILMVLGILLSTTEANHFIRLILNNQIANNLSAEKINFDVGRTIGIIERLIIYIFTLQGEFTAIAFIIAAKSLRMTKEGTPEFAEYVLTGTLLSSAFALAIALLVSKLKIA